MKRIFLIGAVVAAVVALVFVLPYVSPAFLPDDGSQGDRHWETGEEVRLVAVGGLVDKDGGKSVQFHLYYQDKSMSPLEDEAVPSAGGWFVAQLWHDSIEGGNLITSNAIDTDYFVEHPEMVFSTNGMVMQQQAALTSYDHIILVVVTNGDDEPVMLTVDMVA